MELWNCPPTPGAWPWALQPSFAYPGALCLDSFDVQAVLHCLITATGLRVLLRAPATRFSACLTVPILLEHRCAEMHIVALLLGDMSIRAMDRFHMLPERAGVCVAFGAAWDLADVRFLRRESDLCCEEAMKKDSGGVLCLADLG